MTFKRIDPPQTGDSEHFDAIRARSQKRQEARREGFVADVEPLELIPPAPTEGDAEHFDAIRAKKRAEQDAARSAQEERHARYLRELSGEPGAA